MSATEEDSTGEGPYVVETGISRRDGLWYAVVMLNGKHWLAKGPYSTREAATEVALEAGSIAHHLGMKQVEEH